MPSTRHGGASSDHCLTPVAAHGRPAHRVRTGGTAPCARCARTSRRGAACRRSRRSRPARACRRSRCVWRGVARRVVRPGSLEGDEPLLDRSPDASARADTMPRRPICRSTHPRADRRQPLVRAYRTIAEAIAAGGSAGRASRRGMRGVNPPAVHGELRNVAPSMSSCRLRSPSRPGRGPSRSRSATWTASWRSTTARGMPPATVR